MPPFDKNPELIVWEEEPFNAEPPPELLRHQWITPLELFFARNHAPVPDLDAESYRLSVEGKVERPLTLSLRQLREEFPSRSLTATLQCAGNRREELMALGPIPGEVPWRTGAIGNAEWTGVPLREVLLAAGVGQGAEHVAFLGLDEIHKGDRSFGFGGSIPLAKAMGEEVLLAYEMNGERLRAEHGYPLRVMVPGYIGARSVKWLGSIRVQAEPSDNHYQARAYKLFPPDVGPDTADWERAPMLGELAISTVICRPAEGERLPSGPLLVQGYAIAAGSPVESVELSTDGGRSWRQAELVGAPDPWCWRFWEATVEVGAGPLEIIARAFDAAGNGQPERVQTVWNFKGYMNNAWYRVRARAEDASDGEEPDR